LPTLSPRQRKSRIQTAVVRERHQRAPDSVVILFLWTVFIASIPTASAQINKSMSGFEGQAIVHSLDGQIIPPDQAKVWILFGSTVPYEGMPHDYIDSAALYFQNKRMSLLAEINKSLKKELKGVERNQAQKGGALGKPDSEEVNEFHGLTLRIDDQALAATVEWAQKNRDKTWEVKVLPTEPDGKWIVGDLTPGMYCIVVHASFGKFLAAWEANITVRPGQNFTIPQQPSVVYKSTN
jgi:hypothetical protein